MANCTVCPLCGHRVIVSLYVICAYCHRAWEHYQFESLVMADEVTDGSVRFGYVPCSGCGVRNYETSDPQWNCPEFPSCAVGVGGAT